MAIVTGIPNFNTIGSLVGSDLDTAFNALLTQLGGTAWQGSSTPNVVPIAANLDYTNFTAPLSTVQTFKNPQKTQPCSLISMSFRAGTFASTAAGATQTALGGVVEQNMSTVCISTMFGRASVSDIAINGNLVLKVNGNAAAAFPFISSTSKAGIISYSDVHIDLRVGDWLALELGDVYTTSASTIQDLTFVLFSRAEHVS
jgi:hypothetical protein